MPGPDIRAIRMQIERVIRVSRRCEESCRRQQLTTQTRRAERWSSLRWDLKVLQSMPDSELSEQMQNVRQYHQGLVDF